MTIVETMFAVSVAVCAAVTIACETRGPRLGVYVFKPLTTGLVIAMFLAESGVRPRGAAWLFVGAGLAMSLAGDVLLMLESDRFVAGLISFLAAHVCYIASFAIRLAPVEGVAGRVAFWAPVVALVGYVAAMFRYLAPGLGALRAPVAVYIAVITAMVWQAAALCALVPGARSAAALAGAVLFMASDSFLAVDKFRRRVRAGQALILGTYFAAQWLIASSAGP